MDSQTEFTFQYSDDFSLDDLGIGANLVLEDHDNKVVLFDHYINHDTKRLPTDPEFKTTYKLLEANDVNERIKSEKDRFFTVQKEFAIPKFEDPIPTPKFLRVFEFPRFGDVTEFLRAVGQEDWRYKSPLEWYNHIEGKSFVGVQAMGSFGKKEHSILFTSIPYLASSGSMGIAQFFVFDNETIAAFRGEKEEEKKTPAPTIPERGSIHTPASKPATIISDQVGREPATIIPSQTTARRTQAISKLAFKDEKILRDSMAKLCVVGLTTNARTERYKIVGLAIERATKNLNKYAVMRETIEVQVRVLTDFRTLMRNCRHMDLENGHSNKYHRNIVPLPVISRQVEQLMKVLPFLDEIIEDHNIFLQNFKSMFRTVESLHQSAIQIVAIEGQEILQQERMFDAAQELHNEIESQGEALSMFTAVTIFFLPLTFFAGYFALDEPELLYPKQWYFWAISSPVSLVAFCISAYIVFNKEYSYKELWKSFLSIWKFRKNKFYKPVNRKTKRIKNLKQSQGGQDSASLQTDKSNPPSHSGQDSQQTDQSRLQTAEMIEQGQEFNAWYDSVASQRVAA